MFSANLLCYKQLFFLEKRKQKIISLAADQNYSFGSAYIGSCFDYTKWL
ncbi:MAG: hypothetical protein Q8830_02980 [Candidatus Phytoplasma australasiaticum]|nr:hypothetical protein [Candidatus Phytoplasma australasiaticum]